MTTHALVFVVLLLCGLPEAACAATLRVWRDCSTSMSESAYQNVVDMLLKALRPLVQIDRVEIIKFSCGDTRLSTAMPEEIRLTSEAAEPQSPLTRLFRSAEIAVAATNETARDTAIAQRLRPALLAPLGPPARCTRFDGLAARIANENRPLNLVLTDGWPDCRQPYSTLNFKPTTIVVVIPKKDDPISDDASAARARIQQMERFFPGATIVEPYQVDTAFTQHARGAS